MSRVMLTASEARAKALQDTIVLREIRDIEEAILIAAADGEMEVEITDTTTMASSDIESEGFITATQYFDTWTNTRDDRQKLTQMDKIVKYFAGLGYAIERRTNADTGSTFKWVVAW